MDDYSSLAIFANLSSVKAVKNLTLQLDQTVSTEIDQEFDFEKLGSLSKRKEATKSGKRSISKPAKATSSDLCNSSNVSQLKSEETSQNASINGQSTMVEVSTVVSTSKNKTRNRKNTSNEKLSNNQASINPSAAGRRRGRSNSKSLSTSQNTSIIDTTDITDDIHGIQNTIASSINAGATSELSGRTRYLTRSRRNVIAEKAARCHTIGVVDLISSPLPSVKGAIDITLDSDEEAEKQKSITTESSVLFEASFDEENPEISIKIMWNGEIEFFTLRKHQKFEHIFEKLAQNSEIEKKHVFLNLEDRIISPNDTPASINYKIYQVIYGRSMVNGKFRNDLSLEKKKRDRNILKIKVQSDKWKHPLGLELQKTGKLKELFIKCAEELSIPYKNIKLSFDGEPIDWDQTPEDLEFEGGEILDIHFNDKS